MLSIKVIYLLFLLGVGDTVFEMKNTDRITTMLGHHNTVDVCCFITTLKNLYIWFVIHLKLERNLILNMLA